MPFVNPPNYKGTAITLQIPEQSEERKISFLLQNTKWPTPVIYICLEDNWNMNSVARSEFVLEKEDNLISTQIREFLFHLILPQNFPFSFVQIESAHPVNAFFREKTAVHKNNTIFTALITLFFTSFLYLQYSCYSLIPLSNKRNSEPTGQVGIIYYIH